AVQAWAVGVTAESKSRARELLARGNELMVQNRYAEALEQYELAIRAWDHPAIRANMVVCLMNLGRPVEAYESALLALRHGPAPYDTPEVYAAVLNRRKLLEGRIATVDVLCTESGARVSLDGQDLLVCPDRRTRHLLAGKHQLVARKLGFMTATHDIASAGGSRTSIQVRLVRLADAARTERAWDAWKPWAVAGGGAGLLVMGGLLHLKAQSDMDRSDADLEEACGLPGCDGEEIPLRISDLRSRARLENGMAIGAIVAGGAVAVTGLVSAYLNRPRTVLSDENGFRLGLTPLAAPSGAGLTLDGTF
ncbi:MAG TPA: tetratricopeptide repeat protein, partial [Candidatus Acidoferrum sp.]|nr:tetratricopeptide repeat protein [Candidatus Acidoferrum sp.]